MIDPFDSPRRSLKRAKHHVSDLESRVKTFLEGGPGTIVIEDDGDGITGVCKWKFHRRLADDADCVAFDATNNFRVALDQMAYGIAVLFTRKDDPKACKFPFSDSAANLKNHIPGACKDLPPEIRDHFESYKPYKGGNNALWAVNQLANAGKHWRLTPIDLNNVAVEFALARNFIIPLDSPHQPRFDSVKNEIILFKARARQNAECNAQASFTISINHSEEIISRQPAIALFSEIAGIVDSILLGTEAECRRIGLIK